MIIDGIEISPLLKALNKFEQFRLNINTEQEKAGAIQAFEYSYELIWKTMKRFLSLRGIIVNSPRETFRAAALEELIDDPETWFIFIKNRNIITHTYNETEVEKILSIFPLFSSKSKEFLKNIGAA
ncbi:MAG: HI0074 family nucleotidyltransferase substrate-binding subunit [Pseudomonadota bacterium]